MKLSEAILLGDTLKRSDPWNYAPEGACCALGGALLAVGVGADRYFTEAAGSGPVGCFTPFRKRWPWLTSEHFSEISSLYFKVADGRKTIEDVVDYVRSIEPADEPQHNGNTITDLQRAVLNAEIKAGIERNALVEGETDDSEGYAQLSAGIQRGCR